MCAARLTLDCAKLLYIANFARVPETIGCIIQEMFRKSELILEVWRAVGVQLRIERSDGLSLNCDPLLQINWHSPHYRSARSHTTREG